MRVLITGGQGFVGRAVARRLAASGTEVLAPSSSELDVTAEPAKWRALSLSGLDWAIHLAAISDVPSCERDPERAFQVNCEGALRFAEALWRRFPSARLLFASTAQVYAPQDSGASSVSGRAIAEENPIRPQNRYAETKWQAEERLRALSARMGGRLTVVRLFNHTHKSQSTRFFLPHVYSQLLEARRKDPAGFAHIPVGNLDIERDIGSLQDLVRGFEALLGLPDNGEAAGAFNLCSGSRRNLRHLTTRLAEKLSVRADFVTDPARVRPGEARCVFGSHERLTQATGWEAQDGVRSGRGSGPDGASDELFLEHFLADL